MIDIFQIIPKMGLTARELSMFIRASHEINSETDWQPRPGIAKVDYFTRAVPILPTKNLPIPKHITAPLPPLPAAHTYKNTQVNEWMKRNMNYYANRQFPRSISRDQWILLSFVSQLRKNLNK